MVFFHLSSIVIKTDSQVNYCVAIATIAYKGYSTPYWWLIEHGFQHFTRHFKHYVMNDNFLYRRAHFFYFTSTYNYRNFLLCCGTLDGTHRWILIALYFPPRVLETALLERWHFTWLIIQQWLLKRCPTEPIRWQEWACRLLAHKLLFPLEQTFQLFCSSGNSDIYSDCKAPQDRNLL